MSLLPLTDTKILVTRAAGQSSSFTYLLQEQGAEVIEMPALEIRPPSSWESLDAAIARLEDFHWLILTSANGVKYFLTRLLELGKDTRSLGKTKIAVVGKKTAHVLAQSYLRPDFVPTDFIADALVAEFPESLEGKKLLLPRVESGGRQLLIDACSARGAEVLAVPAYYSGCPSQMAPEALEPLTNGEVDIVTFASGKTAKNFHHLLIAALSKKSLKPGEVAAGLLAKTAIASIGPQTSRQCQNLWQRVDIEAKEYTLEGLTEEIVRWITDKRQKT